MKYLKNVSTLSLDEEKCHGCGRCLEVCPHGVFSLMDNRAQINDRDACMECGACRQNCPFGAIAVTSGVGCAYAILYGMLHGTEANCGCAESAQKKTGCCG